MNWCYVCLCLWTNSAGFSLRGFGRFLQSSLTKIQKHSLFFCIDSVWWTLVSTHWEDVWRCFNHLLQSLPLINLVHGENYDSHLSDDNWFPVRLFPNFNCMIHYQKERLIIQMSENTWDCDTCKLWINLEHLFYLISALWHL